MKQLAGKDHWDSIYDGMGPATGSAGFKERLKYLTRDYSNYYVWEVLCRKYLPRDPSYKIVEIGCAPGKYLLQFRRMFGYAPYGVEYSEKGAEITRTNFTKAGEDSGHVFLADFFDPAFQEKTKDFYDVVFSRGFIEHFDDVRHVVALHRNLLRSGGYAVIMIPNLAGLNGFLAKRLNRSTYDLHNISIMDKGTFSELFSAAGFEFLYCGYAGVFSFGLFNTNRRWKYWLYRILLLVQRPFDLVLRLAGGAII
jgi:SAM-dependent methyltransferase